MVATNPELAAMMVSKFTISDSAPDEWRTLYWDEARGRFRFPPGDEGRDARFDGLTKGYMTNTRDDEWEQDAAHAAFSAASRVLSQWWEAKTGREWAKGMTKAVEGFTYTLTEPEAAFLRSVHLPVDAGDYTGTELRAAFDAQKDSWARDFAETSLFKTPTMTALSANPDGRDLFLAIQEAQKIAAKAGYDSFYDWKEPWKDGVRQVFQAAVASGFVTPDGYRQDVEPYFGAIDFAAPEVPLARDLGDGPSLAVPSSWSTVGSGAPGAAQVIDGDSVRLFTADGEVEVRIIGVAAPERTEAGYGEASARLADFMAGHDVEFRVWQPEVYGLSQAVGIEDRVRLRLWLYADGVPVFDPTLFTSENPLGRERSTGAVPDYEGMLAAQKERLGIDVEAVS
jgi:endonuclease YncB( thermonuclease family)